MIEIQSDICALERFAPDLAFKAAAVQEGIIRGYASTFGGEADSYGDVIAAGAFSKTLSEHAGKKTTPAMLWAHDPANPIGKWTRLVEDSMGLAVEGKLTLAVPRAQEAYALAKDGALSFSIGYRTREAGRTANGHRLLKNVVLGEVSLVAMPANPFARITGVKSESAAINDPRAFEEYLRDAGFSRAFSKAIIARGFKAAAGLRDASGAGQSLAGMIRASSLLFKIT